jgi:hypothetical protein
MNALMLGFMLCNLRIRTTIGGSPARSDGLFIIDNPRENQRLGEVISQVEHKVGCKRKKYQTVARTFKIDECMDA